MFLLLILLNRYPGLPVVGTKIPLKLDLKFALGSLTFFDLILNLDLQGHVLRKIKHNLILIFAAMSCCPV